MVWAAGIADRTIPASYYLSGRPAWWASSLSWPSMGGDAPEGRNPAAIRFGAGTPIPTQVPVSVKPEPVAASGFLSEARLLASDGTVVRSWPRGIRVSAIPGDLRGLPAGIYRVVGREAGLVRSRRVAVLGP